METLLLNSLQDYLITGAVLSLSIGFIIQMVNTSPPFTFRDILAVTLTWPFVVGVLITDYFNGEL